MLYGILITCLQASIFLIHWVDGGTGWYGSWSFIHVFKLGNLYLKGPLLVSMQCRDLVIDMQNWWVRGNSDCGVDSIPDWGDSIGMRNVWENLKCECMRNCVLNVKLNDRQWGILSSFWAGADRVGTAGVLCQSVTDEWYSKGAPELLHEWVIVFGICFMLSEGKLTV